MHPKVPSSTRPSCRRAQRRSTPPTSLCKALRLMRHQGLSEAGVPARRAGYRDERRVADDEVAAARAQARAFNATPAQEAEQPPQQQQPSPPKQDSFATRLLRRFAEEAKRAARHARGSSPPTARGRHRPRRGGDGQPHHARHQRHGIRAAVDEAAKAEAEATARMHELRFNEAEEDGDFQAAVRAQEDAESAKGEPSGASTETGEPTKP